MPSAILPPLRSPGDVVGTLLPDVAAELGLTADVPVVAVGSHDTASAVVAAPLGDEPAAYISSGTWSLVGLELDQPVLTDAARAAALHQRGRRRRHDPVPQERRGAVGAVGLLRSWAEAEEPGTDLASLLRAAADAEPLRSVVDINDLRLLAPGTLDDDLPSRVAALAARPANRSPRRRSRSPAASSTALRSPTPARPARRHPGRLAVEVVHVVGGGTRNEPSPS